MPKDDVKDVEAREAQRQHAKRATLDQLLGKKRAEREVTFTLPGTEDEVSFLFRAIGAKEYDNLVSKHPPTPEGRVEGSTFNIHTFAPALLARVVVEPDFNQTEWEKIWNSPDWNRGEVMQFFSIAAELCATGMGIPFIERG